MSAAATDAGGVRWDLTPLAPSEEALRQRLAAAVADAGSFVGRWPHEAVAAIEPPGLAQLLSELASLRAAREEGHWYVFLQRGSDAVNPALGDLQAAVDGLLPALDNAIKHFEIAWAGVADDRARELADDLAVAHDRHYLLSLRRLNRFLLSPAEERALAARDATARSAWQSLQSRTLGALAAPFDDGSGARAWSFSELELARRLHPDRETRRAATIARNDVLEPVLPVLAQCYDALVADRLAVDRLRGHDDPMQPTNLANELEPGVVEALLATTEAHYGLAHRWFARKAHLLGLDKLDTIDLLAPAVAIPPLSWSDGRRLALDVFANLTPTLAANAEAFFTERRIDADPRQGKSPGAFCMQASTRVPGFLLLNWSGDYLSLVFLTHELGHGTHFALAGRAQSDNSFRPGIALGEVPSTFAELRLVDDLLATGDPRARPALARTLDSFVVAVLMQAAYARFEQHAYALRATGDALTAARLGDLCDAELARIWTDAVTDELLVRPMMWAPLPHFIWERFYTYSYTFAFLVAAGLLGRSREPEFGATYENFLAAGHSGSPKELLGPLGVDLDDPGIWDEGFAVIEGWLDRLEA